MTKGKYIRTKEIRKKMGKSLKKRWENPEFKKFMSKINSKTHKGIPKSEEHKKKIGLANLGKHHSEETKLKMSLASLGKLKSKEHCKNISVALKNFWQDPKCKENISNEKNHNWKGDKAGYFALHMWLRKNKPKPLFCEFCNEREPKHLANMKNHQYTRNPEDYKWLCAKCHMEKDGINKLYLQLNRDKYGRFLKNFSNLTILP